MSGSKATGYTLVHVHFSGGDPDIIPTAAVRLTDVEGASIDETAVGGDAIGAVCKVIRRALGLGEDIVMQYGIHKEGVDLPLVWFSVGRQGEDPYFGRESHSDIVVAAARACLFAVNLMLGDDGKPAIRATPLEEEWYEQRFG